MNKQRTAESCLLTLSQNGVRIEEKTASRNGQRIVTARLIKPSRQPGLKVLSAIDCLTKYYRAHKYIHIKSN